MSTTDLRTTIDCYKVELLNQPVGLMASDRKDFLLNACFDSYYEMIEKATPADFSCFKTLAARPGENPYYQGIALFMAGSTGVSAAGLSQPTQLKNCPSGHKDICRPFNELKIGDFVYIGGLSQRPELNQKIGILRLFDVAKGRWNVAIGAEGDVCISVKPDNLTRVVTVDEADQIRAEIAMGKNNTRCCFFYFLLKDQVI
ncbi:hypothetical protein HDU98_010258 [Podochytrium sp. JEL0797]|nr:hypothetical protein HDU98_010240 [Podochytrium sp. JEL0797]KAJ3076982.1 hypothetical protein HDU98_010258 [Podochytrium sp. JEL0797]